MKLSPVELAAQGQVLFKDKYALNSLWQILAEAFYPERADFTVQRNAGDEFADGLLDSFPVIARRDLANSFNTMLRSGEWFEMTVDEEVDHNSQWWLDAATDRQMKLMKLHGTQFTRATKEGDHDFTTFGNTVISCNYNMRHMQLLYRTWHLRDCAWSEDERGDVCTVYRNWKPTLHEAVRTFGDKALHSKHREMLKDHPFKKVDYQHIFLPTDIYGDDELEERFPYMSIFLDVENMHLVEEVGQRAKTYIVPRFSTVSGSQYGHSPAVMTGLPHSRLIQAVTHTILEAGEMFTNPPKIATQGAVRTDMQMYPGGVTWIDEEYDERLGEALRPLTQDMGGFPIGANMREGVREMIAEAFYLNKLVLPTQGDMTAYETSERIREFQRMAKPIFSPMEEEYNGPLCEITFDQLLVNGEFGPPDSIPEDLLEAKVDFKFQSPISESEDRGRVMLFDQTMALTERAAQVDPTVIANVNIDQGLRDAVSGSGAPESWLTPEQYVEQEKAKAAQKQAEAEQLEKAAAATQIAGQAQQTGMLPPV